MRKLSQMLKFPWEADRFPWKSSHGGCCRTKHNEFAIPMLQRKPNQLLWQSVCAADTMTLLSHWRWKRPGSYDNGHGDEPVIKPEVLTLVVVVIVVPVVIIAGCRLWDMFEWCERVQSMPAQGCHLIQSYCTKLLSGWSLWCSLRKHIRDFWG